MAHLLAPLLVGGLIGLARSEPIEFEADVRPILDLYCFECHGPGRPEANLRLDSVSAILKGGDGGPAVLPGRSAESLLYEALINEEGFRMPPEGDPVPEEEIDIIRAWIDQGAKAGRSGAGAGADEDSPQRHKEHKDQRKEDLPL